MVTASELNIDESATAVEMAQEIFGSGVTIVSASYSGDDLSSGIYTGGDATSPGVLPGDSGIILSTGHADDFTNSSGEANQSTNTSTNTSGVNRDPLFDAAAGTRTFDASYLSVDFVPTESIMTMKFVFASEEYPEYQNSIYQDFVGVWVNGSQVDLTIGNGDADPGNVNSTNNENLFVDNTNDAYNTEMDGFTVTLTLTFPVTAGAQNNIVIGIADVSDSQYDSALLIAADSLQSDLIAVDDSTSMFPSGQKTLDVLGNDVTSSGASLTITHINDVAVVAGDTVVLNTGQTVQLNADGTIDIIGDGDAENFNFNYTISDGVDTDTGFVTVNTFPCFVAGTMVATPDGHRPVEQIAAGDRVLTLDDGAKPVRWTGRRRVPASGSLTPVRIKAGAFGSHDDLVVSPQHRILFRGGAAEMLFGETEVLVPAGYLVDGQTVQSVPGDTVEYVHLLFDDHQVVFANGLESESLLPGAQVTEALGPSAMKEIHAIFPHLDPTTGQGYGPAARRVLKRHEARLLMRSALTEKAA